MHAPPPYMYYEKKSADAYGQQYSLEIEVTENLQKKRKRGAVGLDHDEALYDLERMGVSGPSCPTSFCQHPSRLTVTGSAAPLFSFAIPIETHTLLTLRLTRRTPLHPATQLRPHKVTSILAERRPMHTDTMVTRLVSKL